MEEKDERTQGPVKRTEAHKDWRLSITVTAVVLMATSVASRRLLLTATDASGGYIYYEGFKKARLRGMYINKEMSEDEMQAGTISPAQREPSSLIGR